MRVPRKVKVILENHWLRGFSILALVAAIAMLKITHSQITFSYLYLVPIALGVWWFRWKNGLTIAVLCAAIGWALGFGQGAEPSDVINWNAFLRLSVFVGFVMFLQMFRWELERQVVLADTDPHTGLLNIRGFYEKAQRRLDEAVENKKPIALLYLDLDNFKSVNDQYGHLEGDRVLQTVALAMKTYFRSQDLIGRFGGDEFLAFLTGVPPATVEQRVKDFRQHLHGRMQAEKWPVTFSMGCVISLEPPGSLLERIVHNADSLAYEVKDSGKNGLRVKIE